ncbi:hypothetical protein AKJ16_DCAP11350 [Drosera capensis]
MLYPRDKRTQIPDHHSLTLQPNLSPPPSMAPTSAIRSSLTPLSLHLSLRSPAIKPSFHSTLPRAQPFAASPRRSRLNHNRSRTASMVVRAARVESKEVVLGSNPPRFQLPEPLTGRTWTLRDFEASDVLLVKCFLRFMDLFESRPNDKNSTSPKYECSSPKGGIRARKRVENSYVSLQSLPICYSLKRRHIETFKFLYEGTSVLGVFLSSLSLQYDSLPASYALVLQKGLSVVAISSNSVVTHPQDGPEYMAEEAKLFLYPFPYLYDESQDVARDFGAVCTPEFFLFKKDERKTFELVYHGQFDDSRPSNNLPITGRDLRQAIDCALNGQPIPSDQKPRSCSFAIDHRRLQHQMASIDKMVKLLRFPLQLCKRRSLDCT